MAKVGDPNLLINLISRRVRQLNAGGGGLSRPLVDNASQLGASDTALREIIEDKMSWDLAEELEVLQETPKRRRKR
ncbi:MAG: DNA-directed RNA polymerase subunit omega [Verrucomicrobia bacterium]|nr:DNA-directed RNA polymerase subunit omega [Verrucomicrobiota bacterium]